MYNIDIKMRFLNNEYTNEETIKNISRLFNKSEILEQKYNVDLYSFNQNQLYELLRLIDSTTLNALGKDWSTIQRYTKWAATQGYCVPNIAAMSIFRKDLKQFVNKHALKNQFISDRYTFYEILTEVYNPQDQVIPVLLYEGIRGRSQQENSFEEIKNLRGQDCDFDKGMIIVRRNDKTFRILENIDARSMNIIYEALNQDVYYRGNGESKAKDPTLPLVQSDLVVRVAERKNNREIIGTTTIDSRVRTFQRITKKHYLTANNIFFSGMIERLQIIESQRILTKNDYEDIYERFGMNSKGWNNLREKYEHYKENK